MRNTDNWFKVLKFAPLSKWMKYNFFRITQCFIMMFNYKYIDLTKSEGVIEFEILVFCYNHYRDVIMGAMASRITSLTIVYSAVHSGPKKTSKLRVTGLCVWNSPVTGEFPAQMASNAENVSIWWRHHVLNPFELPSLKFYCVLIGFLPLCANISWSYS